MRPRRPRQKERSRQRNRLWSKSGGQGGLKDGAARATGTGSMTSRGAPMRPAAHPTKRRLSLPAGKRGRRPSSPLTGLQASQAAATVIAIRVASAKETAKETAKASAKRRGTGTATASAATARIGRRATVSVRSSGRRGSSGGSVTRPRIRTRRSPNLPA